MVNGLRRTIDLFGVGRIVTVRVSIDDRSNGYFLLWTKFVNQMILSSFICTSFENQRVLPFKISNQLRLCAYLSDATWSILRVYIVKNR
ncbi:hypothetical protein H5410_061662 [Solanum commersonii]|uniref:Uncharacterized protein n=1 Tax=Solanum commersonii TaxID=4109 RepID=A0A9J5W9V5_SOLCO|nr:hypothetical protein H5410_061662 [Solanum commersonii]